MESMNSSWNAFTKWRGTTINVSIGSGLEGKNLWICKPGEDSNRGNGIEVLNCLKNIEEYIETNKGEGKTFIL